MNWLLLKGLRVLRSGTAGKGRELCERGQRCGGSGSAHGCKQVPCVSVSEEASGADTRLSGYKMILTVLMQCSR